METTFGRFYGEVRGFISDLFRNPIKCTVSKYLKERGFSKQKLINELLERGIIIRNERVSDATDSDFDKPTYTVKYKLSKNQFETKVKRMYSKHFEKSLPKKTEENKPKDEEIEECTTCDGVGGQFIQPLTKKPLNQRVLVTENKGRRVIMTEAQLNYIVEHA